MRHALIATCIAICITSALATSLAQAQVEEPLIIPDGTSRGTSVSTNTIIFNGQPGVGRIMIQGGGGVVIQGQMIQGPAIIQNGQIIQGNGIIQIAPAQAPAPVPMHVQIQQGVIQLSPAPALMQVQQAVPAPAPVQVQPVAPAALPPQHVQIAPAQIYQGRTTVSTGPLQLTAAPQSDAEKAIQTFIKAKGGPDAIPGRAALVTDPALALFDGWTFTLVTVPQFPVARMPQPPLKTDNIFAVDAKSNVTQITTVDELQQFFKDHMAPVKTKEDALKAAAAWIALTTEFSQDGMYTFIARKPEIVEGKILMSKATADVDAMGGNQGSISAHLDFDQAGKLHSATEERTVKPGIRPR